MSVQHGHLAAPLALTKGKQLEEWLRSLGLPLYKKFMKELDERDAIASLEILPHPFTNVPSRYRRIPLHRVLSGEPGYGVPLGPDHTRLRVVRNIWVLPLQVIRDTCDGVSTHGLQRKEREMVREYCHTERGLELRKNFGSSLTEKKKIRLLSAQTGDVEIEAEVDATIRVLEEELGRKVGRRHIKLTDAPPIRAAEAKYGGVEVSLHESKRYPGILTRCVLRRKRLNATNFPPEFHQDRYIDTRTGNEFLWRKTSEVVPEDEHIRETSPVIKEPPTQT